MSSAPLDLSLVMPAFDEVDGIESAIKRIGAFLTSTGLAWELVVVIDGGPQLMASLARRVSEGNPGRSGQRLGRNSRFLAAWNRVGILLPGRKNLVCRNRCSRRR